jgi:hypothetical protein
VRDSWANGLGANIQHLERLLTYYDHQPPHWAENVYELIDGFKTSLEKMGQPGSLRFLEGSAQSFDITQVQGWIRQFGELMVYWPDVFEEAKKIREEGGGLARKV